MPVGWRLYIYMPLIYRNSLCVCIVCLRNTDFTLNILADIIIINSAGSSAHIASYKITHRLCVAFLLKLMILNTLLLIRRLSLQNGRQCLTRLRDIKDQTNPLWCTFIHNDVMKWKHFPRYWLFVLGIHRSPVNSPYKGQWRGISMFSLICTWTNGWVNTRDVSDLRRHRPDYDDTKCVYGRLFTIYISEFYTCVSEEPFYDSFRHTLFGNSTW